MNRREGCLDYKLLLHKVAECCARAMLSVSISLLLKYVSWFTSLLAP